MTPHNDASRGDYAEAVLLPGDPLRAQWIAETFLEASRCVKRLIHVGACGGLTEKVKLRDIVIAQTASTDGSMNRNVFGPFEFRPAAGSLHPR